MLKSLSVSSIVGLSITARKRKCVCVCVCVCVERKRERVCAHVSSTSHVYLLAHTCGHCRAVGKLLKQIK
jgi:hypothetical protein